MFGWVTKHDKEIKARIEKEGNEREAIGLEKGEAIGLEKGEAIGLEKGEAIGLQKGYIMIAGSVSSLMKSLSIDFEKACTLLGIAENKEQILAIVKELRNGKDALE